MRQDIVGFSLCCFVGRLIRMLCCCHLDVACDKQYTFQSEGVVDMVWLVVGTGPFALFHFHTVLGGSTFLEFTATSTVTFRLLCYILVTSHPSHNMLFLHVDIAHTAGMIKRVNFKHHLILLSFKVALFRSLGATLSSYLQTLIHVLMIQYLSKWLHSRASRSDSVISHCATQIYRSH